MAVHVCLYHDYYAERCRSGRTGWFRKPVKGLLFPGFESLSLRQLFITPGSAGSYFVFQPLVGTMWAQSSGLHRSIPDQTGQKIRADPSPTNCKYHCLCTGIITHRPRQRTIFRLPRKQRGLDVDGGIKDGVAKATP